MSIILIAMPLIERQTRVSMCQIIRPLLIGSHLLLSRLFNLYRLIEVISRRYIIRVHPLSILVFKKFIFIKKLGFNHEKKHFI